MTKQFLVVILMLTLLMSCKSTKKEFTFNNLTPQEAHLKWQTTAYHDLTSRNNSKKLFELINNLWPFKKRNISYQDYENSTEEDLKFMIKNHEARKSLYEFILIHEKKLIPTSVPLSDSEKAYKSEKILKNKIASEQQSIKALTKLLAMKTEKINELKAREELINITTKFTTNNELRIVQEACIIIEDSCIALSGFTRTHNNAFIKRNIGKHLHWWEEESDFITPKKKIGYGNYDAAIKSVSKKRYPTYPKTPKAIANRKKYQPYNINGYSPLLVFNELFIGPVYQFRFESMNKEDRFQSVVNNYQFGLRVAKGIKSLKNEPLYAIGVLYLDNNMSRSEMRHGVPYFSEYSALIDINKNNFKSSFMGHNQFDKKTNKRNYYKIENEHLIENKNLVKSYSNFSEKMDLYNSNDKNRSAVGAAWLRHISLDVINSSPELNLNYSEDNGALKSGYYSFIFTLRENDGNKFAVPFQWIKQAKDKLQSELSAKQGLIQKYEKFKEKKLYALFDYLETRNEFGYKNKFPSLSNLDFVNKLVDNMAYQSRIKTYCYIHPDGCLFNIYNADNYNEPSIFKVFSATGASSSSPAILELNNAEQQIFNLDLKNDTKIHTQVVGYAKSIESNCLARIPCIIKTSISGKHHSQFLFAKVASKYNDKFYFVLIDAEQAVNIVDDYEKERLKGFLNQDYKESLILENMLELNVQAGNYDLLYVDDKAAELIKQLYIDFGLALAQTCDVNTKTINATKTFTSKNIYGAQISSRSDYYATTTAEEFYKGSETYLQQNVAKYWTKYGAHGHLDNLNRLKRKLYHMGCESKSLKKLKNNLIDLFNLVGE